jgi:hypothetical protein
MASGDGMANELRKIWKDAVVKTHLQLINITYLLRYCPRIYVQELKNAKRNLNQSNGSSGYGPN